MTPAERHEQAVRHGVEVYRKTFIRLFAGEVAGGRVPGLAAQDAAQARAFFDERTPEAWYQSAMTNPAAAMRELTDYARLQA